MPKYLCQFLKHFSTGDALCVTSVTHSASPLRPNVGSSLLQERTPAGNTAYSA